MHQAGRREVGALSNGEAVVNDLLRTFDPDIVMEAMDQCWNRFQAELSRRISASAVRASTKTTSSRTEKPDVPGL